MKYRVHKQDGSTSDGKYVHTRCGRFLVSGHAQAGYVRRLIRFVTCGNCRRLMLMDARQKGRK